MKGNVYADEKIEDSSKPHLADQYTRTRCINNALIHAVPPQTPQQRASSRLHNHPLSRPPSHLGVHKAIHSATRYPITRIDLTSA
jgi:hypothetical protein